MFSSPFNHASHPWVSFIFFRFSPSQSKMPPLRNSLIPMPQYQQYFWWGIIFPNSFCCIFSLISELSWHMIWILPFPFCRKTPNTVIFNFYFCNPCWGSFSCNVANVPLEINLVVHRNVDSTETYFFICMYICGVV